MTFELFKEVSFIKELTYECYISLLLLDLETYDFAPCKLVLTNRFRLTARATEDPMKRLLFILILAAIALLLFLIGGKRERKKIPAGMTILCQNPFLRYVLYALGVFLFLFTEGACYIGYRLGGAKDAGIWFSVCAVLGALVPLLLFLCGYTIYARHIFFNEEKLLIGRVFRAPLRLSWREIGEMRRTDRQSFVLLDRGGKIVVNAYCTMVNYALFLQTAERHCGAARIEEQQVERGTDEKILKYSGEYVVLGVLCVALFALAALICISGGADVKTLLADGRIPLFSRLFPFLSGLCGIGLLLVCRFRKVVCTSYEIRIHYLLRRPVVISWKEVTAAELKKKGRGTEKRYLLRLQTASGACAVNSRGMYAGWPEFLPLLLKICHNGRIPLTLNGVPYLL